ncbi:pre-rRNA-processing protein TSR1 homolog [Saccoglossus kowalevskii]|uniref:Pre-rRNA-processing protein TSR1 homolog n=1 Tax=Saccoglossus kowalevskii TaxID=10224 RepID=A0ABM0MTZ5_SACKO|nr:PREDICTED: pre-rRNA-processing protein TSR1 homolog [Saccoglossus kowalevskii]
MAADSEHSHRPGIFKQKNKSHKTGRHRSKGIIDKDTKGKVGAKVLSKRARNEMRKVDRRNKAKQNMMRKRGEVIMKKRNIGTASGAPHLVGIIPLSSDIDVNKVLNSLKSCEESVIITHNNNITNIVVPRFKSRVSFIAPSMDGMTAILDIAKVADSLLCVMSADNGWDKFGDHCLSCLFGQGLPATLHVVQGLNDLPIKKRTDAKRNLQKVLEKRFPEKKLHTLDSDQDALLLLRQISNQKLRELKYRNIRPHLLARNVIFEPNSDSDVVGTLKVTGFLRGSPLSVNGIVHLPGFGDFQMKQIDLASDPCPLNPRVVKNKKENMQVDDDTSPMDEDIKVLEVANPSKQESLESEVIPDPMEGEQTWPTVDELAEAEAAQKAVAQKRKILKKVPKGTSEYQSAWIIDDDEQVIDDDDDNESDSGSDDDDEFAAIEDSEEEDSEEDGGKMDYETMTMTEIDDDEQYDKGIDEEQERLMWEKYIEQRHNEMFPDEIDTPMDTAARIRFQKYRGLQSFRTSTWDPKENLPSDYARIFQFQNFARTKSRVLKEDRDAGVMPGWYVTLHIINVPKTFIDNYESNNPLVIFGLLQHEQKMSVVHFAIKKHPSFTKPIKSKELLLFQVGCRRFRAAPVFSQHTVGDKQKYERFLVSDAVTVATIYAPITFPPTSIMVFKEGIDGCHNLVATGTLLGVNPDRIVCKRAVLSGHPLKINKKKSVVRYMFFNREDIQWFKPIELRTKWGRRGHIKEPIGTHGHMKCVFDRQLKSQDTVLMNIYKRVYPKWTFDPYVPLDLKIKIPTSDENEDEEME